MQSMRRTLPSRMHVSCILSRSVSPCLFYVLGVFSTQTCGVCSYSGLSATEADECETEKWLCGMCDLANVQLEHSPPKTSDDARIKGTPQKPSPDSSPDRLPDRPPSSPPRLVDDAQLRLRLNRASPAGQLIDISSACTQLEPEPDGLLALPPKLTVPVAAQKGDFVEVCAESTGLLSHAPTRPMTGDVGRVIDSSWESNARDWVVRNRGRDDAHAVVASRKILRSAEMQTTPPPSPNRLSKPAMDADNSAASTRHVSAERTLESQKQKPPVTAVARSPPRSRRSPSHQCVECRATVCVSWNQAIQAYHCYMCSSTAWNALPFRRRMTRGQSRSVARLKSANERSKVAAPQSPTKRSKGSQRGGSCEDSPATKRVRAHCGEVNSASAAPDVLRIPRIPEVGTNLAGNHTLTPPRVGTPAQFSKCMQHKLATAVTHVDLKQHSLYLREVFHAFDNPVFSNMEQYASLPQRKVSHRCDAGDTDATDGHSECDDSQPSPAHFHAKHPQLLAVYFEWKSVEEKKRGTASQVDYLFCMRYASQKLLRRVSKKDFSSHLQKLRKERKDKQRPARDFWRFKTLQFFYQNDWRMFALTTHLRYRDEEDSEAEAPPAGGGSDICVDTVLAYLGRDTYKGEIRVRSSPPSRVRQVFARLLLPTSSQTACGPEHSNADKFLEPFKLPESMLRPLSRFGLPLPDGIIGQLGRTRPRPEPELASDNPSVEDSFQAKCGSRVEAKWPRDRRFYAGRIVGVVTPPTKYEIAFDDGEYAVVAESDVRQLPGGTKSPDSSSSVTVLPKPASASCGTSRSPNTWTVHAGSDGLQPGSHSGGYLSPCAPGVRLANAHTGATDAASLTGQPASIAGNFVLHPIEAQSLPPTNRQWWISSSNSAMLQKQCSAEPRSSPRSKRSSMRSRERKEVEKNNAASSRRASRGLGRRAQVMPIVGTEAAGLVSQQKKLRFGMICTFHSTVRWYAPFIVWCVSTGRSPIHAWGVFAEEPLREGDFVLEYKGEIIRQPLDDVSRTTSSCGP